MIAPPPISQLRSLKGKRQILTMHVDSAAEAAAAAEAGIEMFTCEFDEKLPAIRAAAPGVFIQTGTPQGLFCSPESAIREAFKIMEMGVDAIYFAGGLHITEAMALEGIPVTGHVGYVPRWRTWTGVRAVGKTAEEAIAIYRKVKALESAGAWAVEMELVPTQVASYITKQTHLITEGMGCGDGCDTQYLFSCDVLGTNTGHMPRHAKKYAELAREEERLQKQRVQAFRAFADDCKNGAYPEPKHVIQMPHEAFEQFIEGLKDSAGS